MIASAGGRRRPPILRWPAVWIGAVVFALAGAMVAVVQHRTTVAEHVIRNALTGLGLTPVSLTVDAVGLERIVVSDIGIDGVDPLLLRRLEVRYAAADLLRRRVGQVHASKLELRGRYAEGRLSLGPLDRVLDKPADDVSPPVTPWTVATLRLTDATIVLVSPQGTLRGAFGGDGIGLGDGRYEVSLYGEGQLTLPSGDAVPFEATAAVLAGPEAIERLAVDTEIVRPPIPGLAALDARVEASLVDRAATLRTHVRTSTGFISLAVDGELPAEPTLAALNATVRIDAEAPPIPFLEARTARLRARISDGTLALTGGLEAREGRISIEAEGPVPDQPQVVALRGRAMVTAALADLALPGLPGPLAVDGIVALGATAEGIAIAVPEKPLRASLALAEPVSIRIEPQDGDLLTLPWDVAAGAPAALQGSRAVIGAVGEEWALTGLAAVARMTEPSTGQTVLSVNEGRLSHLGEPALVAPLDLTGQATKAGEDIRFACDLRGADDRLSLTAEGTVDGTSGDAEGRFELRPLLFEPESLQPKDIAPRHGRLLDKVSGVIKAGGRVFWRRGAPSSDIRVDLQDLSFRYGDIGVLGARSTVRVDRPWPPHTPPNQRLRIALIDAGLPLTDADVGFRLDDEGRLRLDEVRVSVLGGRVALAPTLLDPKQDRQSTTLQVTSIDLSAVPDLAELADAHMTGSLSGRVPVEWSAVGLSVRGGLLEADGPGQLRYTPAEAPAALQGGGEGVSLMLEALKIFGTTEFVSASTAKPAASGSRQF